MNARPLFLAALLLIGCETRSGPREIPVPTASEQQAAALQRWEMTCTALDPDRPRVMAIQAALDGNRLGRENWEPIGISDGVACFKRPKL